MRALLDTHAWLWWLEGVPTLGPQALQVMQDPSTEVYFSVASAWELAIKLSLGKLVLAQEFGWVLRQLGPHRVQSLGIGPEHCERVRTLPYHHRDPFDRMLVAQALCEGLTLLSKDTGLDAYGAPRIW